MSAEYSPVTVPDEAIRTQLGRILTSSIFARSDRMKRFLEHVVEESMRGHHDTLKEYNIALNVYDKVDSFDPRIDPIVRVEASRLRAKLREYYENQGRNDGILISIPKNSYAAVFRFSQSPDVRGPAATGADLPLGHLSEASHFLIRGRYHWNRRRPEALAEGIECFNKAIALDPSAVDAYAGLADCYASLAWYEGGPPLPLWSAAEESARRVEQMDSSLAQPLTTLGCKFATCDCKWVAAEELFRRAIDRDPQYATTHHWYAFFCLAPQRQLNEALAEIGVACNLDPLSPVIATHRGAILYFRRQYDEAIEQCRAAIALDPTFYLAYWYLGFAQTQLCCFEDGLASFLEAQELGHSAPHTQAAVGYAYGRMGRSGDAEQVRASLIGDGLTGYVSPVNFALIHSALGDVDTAFYWLDKAVAERASAVTQLKITPVFDSLKTDHRFLRILSRLNLS